MTGEIVAPKNNTPIYPCLVRNKQYGFVVLAISLQSGVIVASEDKSFSVGYHSYIWTRFNDKTAWELFYGEILLKSRQDNKALSARRVPT